MPLLSWLLLHYCYAIRFRRHMPLIDTPCFRCHYCFRAFDARYFRHADMPLRERFRYAIFATPCFSSPLRHWLPYATLLRHDIFLAACPPRHARHARRLPLLVICYFRLLMPLMLFVFRHFASFLFMPFSISFIAYFRRYFLSLSFFLTIDYAIYYFLYWYFLFDYAFDYAFLSFSFRFSHYFAIDDYFADILLMITLMPFISLLPYAADIDITILRWFSFRFHYCHITPFSFFASSRYFILLIFYYCWSFLHWLISFFFFFFFSFIFISIYFFSFLFIDYFHIFAHFALLIIAISMAFAFCWYATRPLPLLIAIRWCLMFSFDVADAVCQPRHRRW